MVLYTGEYIYIYIYIWIFQPSILCSTMSYRRSTRRGCRVGKVWSVHLLSGKLVIVVFFVCMECHHSKFYSFYVSKSTLILFTVLESEGMLAVMLSFKTSQKYHMKLYVIASFCLYIFRLISPGSLTWYRGN